MGVVVRCHPTQDQQEASLGRLACHFIVNTSRVHIIHTLYILHNNLYIRVYVCIIHLILYCQNVQSRQWLPSIVTTVCVLLCSIPSRTIGWNASNLSPTHWEDTPDTLLVNVESIFSFCCRFFIFVDSQK